MSNKVSLLSYDRSKPLQIWEKQVRNGHIKRLTDADIQSSVLEIMGTNVSTNYITCPVDPKKTLAIKLPFLVMIIKNVSRAAQRRRSGILKSPIQKLKFLTDFLDF